MPAIKNEPNDHGTHGGPPQKQQGGQQGKPTNTDPKKPEHTDDPRHDHPMKEEPTKGG